MDVLKRLSIQPINPGASAGYNWFLTKKMNILDSYNPATGEILAKVNRSDAADLAIIIEQSQKTFMNWQQVPAPKRAELIRVIAEELRAKKDLLGTLVSLEVGKIKQEGEGEVQEMIDMADFAVGLARMLYGKTMPSERPQHRMYEQWYPLGPTAVITAFNFPVAVWAWNAFIAAVCGNTIIWKPSPKAPLTAIAVQTICQQAMDKLGYPGVFSLLITDDNQLTSDLVADHRIPLVSFTGSISVGKKINEIVAKRLGRCLLELSGNNAVIVDETANLKSVLPAIVFGAVGTAGQRCTSIRRLIVHKSRVDKLVNQLIPMYEKIKIGNPLHSNVLLGPLIDAAAVTSYKTTIAEIKKLGGKVLYGGETISGDGYFVKPTIVTAQNNWPIVQQETFAPILYVMSYDNFAEAIALQNGVPQGLSSALFTEDLRHAEYFLSTIGSDCGIANINIGTSGAEIGGAFGGEKQTGGGREAGSDAWKAYMRRQTNTINWGTSLTLAQGIKFDID